MAAPCPLCRAPLAPAATHCARCGARVAALPRRGRVPAADIPDAVAVDTVAEAGAARARAAARGVAWGLAVTAGALLLALLARAAGRDANAVFGDVTLGGAGAWLCAAVAAGGLRMRRWAEREEALVRLHRASGITARRVLCLAAAGELVVAAAVAAATR